MSIHLKVGIGQSIITPPVGALLVGYAPARPAKSINDDLTVTAYLFEYHEVKALLITATIISFDNEKYVSIRKALAEKIGVPHTNIIMCATHTHSGPETAEMRGWGDRNEQYYTEIMEPRLNEAVDMAVNSLQPVKVGIATIQSDVGINRRSIDQNGNIGLGQCPWGYYDSAMTVISFKGTDGSILGNIIHYSAHCTAAGKNDEVTRDWAGPMVDILTEQTNGISAFCNGAIGDTGPRLPNEKTTGSLKLALDLGAKAGIDAVGAWRSIKEWRDLDLDIVSGDIKLPYSPLPTFDEAKEKIKKYDNPETLYGMEKADYIRWKEIIDIYESGNSHKTHFIYEQSILRLGPVVIVPFPFEMFVEMQLRLRSYSQYQHTLCLSNANGAHAYFPTQDQFCRGGYEIAAMKICNTYILAPDADNYAVNQNLALIEKLYK